MNAFSRRGACPALSAPMQTGDGLLVRLNPIAAGQGAEGLSPKTLIGLCESAARHGNGIIEVTQRGSIQIRGLTPSSARKLALEIDALAIAVRTGVPVETGPLAGLDPDEIADPRPLAHTIRAAVESGGLSRRLGPKVSVVIDGGGRISMDDVLADVRMTAFQQGGETSWHLAIGGSATTARALGILAEADACKAVVAIFEAIKELGLEGRARDLQSSVLDQIICHLECLRSFAPPSGLPAISPARGEITPSSLPLPIVGLSKGDGPAELPISPLAEEISGRTEGGGTKHQTIRPIPARGRLPIGILPLNDATHALALALPFGSMPAQHIADLAQTAASLGATEIRPAPGRMLLMLGLSADCAETLQARASTLGFVTDSVDARLHIAACPGAPACASGRIATRILAERIARQGRGLLDGSFALHISGCAKGCAHPAAASLTLVGGENGVALVVNGTAGAPASIYTVDEQAAAGLERIASLVAKNRALGETAAACLARLGDTRLVQAFAAGQQG